MARLPRRDPRAIAHASPRYSVSAALVPVLRVAAATALCLIAVFACVPRGAAVQAPMDVTVAPLSGFDAGPPSTAGRPAGRCSLRLTAAPIEKSTRGCVIDELISKGPGTLFYPCSGDGAAEAEFGTQRYNGKITGGEVEVELLTELDWEDGCRWGTHAVIGGTVLSGAEPALRRLKWTYRDSVLTGSNCSGICTAKTTIAVSSTKDRAPLQVPTHEGDEDEDEDRD